MPAVLSFGLHLGRIGPAAKRLQSSQRPTRRAVMKRSIVSVYLVGGFLLSLVASACDNPRQQSSSPIAPSATHSGNVSMGAWQSSGRSLTDHTLPPPQNFDVFDPCSGTPDVLTAHPVE